MLRVMIVCGMLTFITSCSAAEQAQSPAVTKQPLEENWQEIDNELADLMARYKAPSLSVAVIKDGEIIYSQAYGFNDLQKQTKATTQSQYAIGSVVKTFTSGLIGQLEAEGLLDLSAHPSEYLENLQFKSSDLNQHLKIENLLSQTSGLPDISGSLAFFPAENQQGLMPRLAEFPASCRVDSCWAYNNLNFIMLDAIAENVTGKSKSDLFAEYLLRPAGLKNTLSSDTAFRNSEHAVTGYAQVDSAPAPTELEFIYGEHIYTTATDLARWLDVWMNKDNGILNPEYVLRATSMQAISDGRPPSTEEPSAYLDGYGYGWRIRSRDGDYQVEHGGNENGFSTQVLSIPAKNIGVVALTNQQNSILPYIANDILLRQVMGLEKVGIENYPIQVREAARLATSESSKLSLNAEAPLSLDIETLTGSYAATGYGKVEVKYSDDILTLETPAAKFILTHEAENVFGLSSDKPLPLGINIDFFTITFSDNALSANIAAQPVVFKRIQ